MTVILDTAGESDAAGSLLAQDRVSADFFQYGSVLKSPFFKNNLQCLIPFVGTKVSFFLSCQLAKPCHKVKKQFLPDPLYAGSMLQWGSVVMGGASTSRLHRVLSLWAGASNPWLLGTWNGKKVGLKISQLYAECLCHSILGNLLINVHSALSKLWMLSTLHGFKGILK